MLPDMSELKFGYARISTSTQLLDQQLDELRAAGVSDEHIYTDRMNGTRTDRPGLERLLSAARDGDTIVVVALDRLGRSLVHMIETIDQLEQRGIRLTSLRENIDFGTPTGRLMAAVFASLAQYEQELIRERAAAAREAAAARGRRSGRPRALSDEQVQLAQRMRESGETITTIGRTLGASRATIYRSLEREVAA